MKSEKVIPKATRIVVKVRLLISKIGHVEYIGLSSKAKWWQAQNLHHRFKTNKHKIKNNMNPKPTSISFQLSSLKLNQT